MVLILEATDLDESKDRLELLQRLPRVLSAELAEYAIENEDAGAEPRPDDMRREA